MGVPVAAIARWFRVSRSFFSRLLHEDSARHALAVEARRRAAGDALLAEAAALIDGNSRPDAERLRAVLGNRAADLDRATLAVLDRLRGVLTGERNVMAGTEPLELSMRHVSPLDFGRLHLEALRAQPLPSPTTSGGWEPEARSGIDASGSDRPPTFLTDDLPTHDGTVRKRVVPTDN